MSPKSSGRRRFLKDTAALVGLAAGVVPSAGAQMADIPTRPLKMVQGSDRLWRTLPLREIDPDSCSGEDVPG